MRKRTLTLTAAIAFITSFILAAKSFASVYLMGVAFALMGGIIALTINSPVLQGIFARNGTGSSQAAGSTVVTPNGNVGRAGAVQWVDLRDFDASTKLPKVKQADASLKVPYDKIADAARANPSKYPKLNDAATSIGSDKNLDLSAKIGDVFKAPLSAFDSGLYANPDVDYKVSSVTVINDGNGCWGLPPTNACGQTGMQWRDAHTVRYGSGSCDPVCAMTVKDFTLVEVPKVPRKASGNEFAPRLAKVPPGSLAAPADVYSDFYGEIDDFLKNESGSFSVVDAYDPANIETAQPYTLPSFPTQAQVGAASSLYAGQGDVAAANNAVAIAQQNYNNNPTPENAQTLADAQAAAAAAAARYAELERQLEELLDDGDGAITPSLPGDSVYDSDFDLPELKGIAGLLTQFVSNSPLAGMVRSFSISTGGGESSFSAGQVYGRELSFSFSRWEPYLRMCGGALIIIAHGFAVMIVIRGW